MLLRTANFSLDLMLSKYRASIADTSTSTDTDADKYNRERQLKWGRVCVSVSLFMS